MQDQKLKKEFLSLLNLWKGYPGFREDAKFSTWLYRVALNTAITGLKKRKRQAGLTSLEDRHEKI